MMGPTARPSTGRWTRREGEPLGDLVAVGVMICMWLTRKEAHQLKQDRPSGTTSINIPSGQAHRKWRGRPDGPDAFL